MNFTYIILNLILCSVTNDDRLQVSVKSLEISREGLGLVAIDGPVLGKNVEKLSVSRPRFGRSGALHCVKDKQTWVIFAGHMDGCTTKLATKNLHLKTMTMMTI